MSFQAAAKSFLGSLLVRPASTTANSLAGVASRLVLQIMNPHHVRRRRIDLFAILKLSLKEER
jgi:hypothetical protein